MSIIDPQALEPYREMMGDAFIIDIIETYLSNSQVLLNDIMTSLESGKIIEFTRGAHTLKSSSATVGAQALADICLNLEQAGKAGQIENLEPTINELRLEHENTCLALKKMLDSIPR